MADIWPDIGEVRSWDGPEASTALTQSPTQCFCCVMNLYQEVLQLCTHSLRMLATLPDNSPLLQAIKASNGAESH